MNNTLSKAIIILVSVFLVTCTNSCRVKFVPDFDSELYSKIETTSKAVDRFYLLMLETTSAKDNERAYSNFSKQYVEIEVELNSLLLQNKIRPLNENSTRICEIILQTWNKYKEEHKEDNSISDGLIKINQTYMQDLFFALQVSEKAKEILINQPK
ncbi:MAG: hypothetical protein A2W91_19590 [Bacteroidetes bacterium GWF2_38_335]|nr:MAG: hypothetical protein A2W91_19590 [Bacteroidetes bacterium GWF2_38_335]OFY79960.1 MAG: hypothetical protein A2281_10990 [Bacteroidetes bacterium RIFOXYA12_FULL_38_20]HBS86419.1 hypothetical protein [Bacteroidales bacterium]